MARPQWTTRWLWLQISHWFHFLSAPWAKSGKQAGLGITSWTSRRWVVDAGGHEGMSMAETQGHEEGSRGEAGTAKTDEQERTKHRKGWWVPRRQAGVLRWEMWWEDQKGNQHKRRVKFKGCQWDSLKLINLSKWSEVARNSNWWDT